MSVVKQLREKMLLTQKEFANVLNVSRTTVSAYESGIAIPRFKMIRKLIDLGQENGIEIDVNDIYKDKE